MQRVRGHALIAELLGQIEGVHDLRELALAVRAHAAVVALEHDVVEVDRHLPGGGDVDDARRRGGDEAVAQQRREQEAGEVVDREAQLVAIGALRAAIGVRCADARVVDENVETVRDLLGEGAHRVERGEVAGHEAYVAGTVEQIADRLPRALLGAGMSEDRGSIAGQARGERPAEAVGGSGDEDGGHAIQRSDAWHPSLRD
jgi:hypothetical protein